MTEINACKLVPVLTSKGSEGCLFSDQAVAVRDALNGDLSLTRQELWKFRLCLPILNGRGFKVLIFINQNEGWWLNQYPEFSHNPAYDRFLRLKKPR